MALRAEGVPRPPPAAFGALALALLAWLCQIEKKSSGETLSETWGETSSETWGETLIMRHRVRHGARH